METWIDFEIVSPEPGVKLAARPGLQVIVVGETGEVFHRRAIKINGEVQTQVDMLVGRLDGVSVYVKDGTIVLTKEDLYL